MLAAISATLQAVDTSLLTVGVGVLLWHVVALARSPLRTNPLREAAWVVDLRQSAAAAVPLGAPEPAARAPVRGDLVRSEIGFLHVVAVLFVYFAAMAGFGMLIPGAANPNAAPGSDEYFRGHIVFHLGSGVAAAFMLTLLAAVGRRPAPRRPGVAALRSVAIAIPAVIALTPVVMLVVAAALVVTQFINPEIPPVEHVALEALRNNQWGTPGVMLLAGGAVIAAPLVEELFFRGILLRALFGVTHSAWLSVASSGLLFGLMHFSVPYAVVPLTFLGLALAYIRLRYDSLAACVIVHALFNARTMLFAILAPELMPRG